MIESGMEPIRALILVLALSVASCATSIGVRKATPEEVNSSRNQSALTNGKPSPTSMQFMYRLDLVERAKEDPRGAMSALRAGLGQADEPARLVALAELSFIYATQSGDRSYALAAAAYAWAFLFPEDRSKRPGRYDFRVPLALGIYDRAITQGLRNGEGTPEVLDLSARSVSVPFGTLQLSVPSGGFRDAGSELTDFVSLADFNLPGCAITTANRVSAQPSSRAPPPRAMSE